MRKGVVTLTAFIAWLSFTVFAAQASGSLSVSLAVEPKPIFGQIRADETYEFNVTVTNDGLAIGPGEPTKGDQDILYTGNLIALVDLNWRGSGTYDFGSATTGYSTPPLDDVGYTGTISAPMNGSSEWSGLNHTFVRDAFDFGMKPFEKVEVSVKVKVYYEVYNQSDGPGSPYRGALAGEASTTLKLLDDDKIRYTEGKFTEMAAEITPLEELAEAEQLNVSRFMGYLSEMNRSLVAGDYFSALKNYQKYDEKYRAQMIGSLTADAASSYGKTQTIKQLMQDYDFLNVSYSILEDRYVSLSQTYQRKQGELEAAKQNLTTAITVVFAASIAFFFVGRRSRGNAYLSEPRVSDEEMPDDAEPGVR
ncbi:hypothetical protein JXL21_10545 [Candidatus Bathyarchaeota archaeon]|nr:hypothetical protein [Candidatus Bathyarchaeota archaeon]